MKRDQKVRREIISISPDVPETIGANGDSTAQNTHKTRSFNQAYLCFLSPEGWNVSLLLSVDSHADVIDVQACTESQPFLPPLLSGHTPRGEQRTKDRFLQINTIRDKKGPTQTKLTYLVFNIISLIC